MLSTDMFQIYRTHFQELSRYENNTEKEIESTLDYNKIEYKKEDSFEVKFMYLRMFLERTLSRRVEVYVGHYYKDNYQQWN